MWEAKAMGQNFLADRHHHYY